MDGLKEGMPRRSREVWIAHVTEDMSRWAVVQAELVQPVLSAPFKKKPKPPRGWMRSQSSREKRPSPRRGYECRGSEGHAGGGYIHVLEGALHTVNLQPGPTMGTYTPPTGAQRRAARVGLGRGKAAIQVRSQGCAGNLHGLGERGQAHVLPHQRPPVGIALVWSQPSL